MRTLSLSDIGRIVTGKTPPTSDQSNYGGAVPFVTPSDMDGRRCIERTLRCLTEAGAQVVRSSRVQGPAVVVSCIGSDMGKSAVVRGDFVTNQQINTIILNAGIDPLYVYYNLSARRAEIRNLAGGAAQPIMNKSTFGALPIKLPDFAEQVAIGRVLGSLDDKIELNRRMNETLEAMAQAIFRDWFVDFGPVRRKLAGATDPIAIMGGLTPDPARAAELVALFPAALGEDELPLGWRLMALSDVATHCKGAVDPQKSPQTLFEHYSLPAYDAGQEPARDPGASIKSNKVLVPPGAVLVSKLNPEILRVWAPNDYVGAPQVASTEFLVFTPKPAAGRGLLYFLFRDPTVRQIMEGMVTGTSKSHQRISPPALLQTKLVVGDPGAFAAFEELVDPVLRRSLALRAESRTLAEMRDYLLPRLMSGEIRVGDVNCEIAA